MSSLSGLSGSSLSTPTSFSGSAVNVTGLISGLNTNSVIQGLLAVEQQKITFLERNKQTVTAQQTAFQAVEAKLLGLQAQLTALTSSQNSVFAARAATSSAPTLLNAAASSSAAAGVYHLRVNSTATASQIASQGLDSLASTISQGTLQLKVGNATTTVTIDSSNNTLQGLASAINSSGAAVTAIVVNDGSGDGQQGYRLVLASRQTGISNQITITNNLDPGGGGVIKPVFDVGTISGALPAAGFSGTASIQSNAGTGYTGNSNNTYTFTVVQGGTVGTDNNIQLAYADATGTNTGTITLNQGDVDVLKSVAQGIQVQFSAGTLVSGDSFSVKAFVPIVQAATDASLTLGSGNGALAVHSSTNQINSLIPGVTLSLLGSDPNTDVAVTVATDTANMQKAVQSFVSAYNDIVKTIDQLTSYDADSQQAGSLLGNFPILSIDQQVRRAVGNAVPGVNPLMNNLGALGIKTGANGQLVLDDAKLSNVLSGNVAGVTTEDVRKLFSLTGSSTNPGVQFITGSTKTQSSATPYILEITQAAQQASLTAPNAVAASTVIDNTNNAFSISLDGKTSSTLTLAAGTYTQTALAQAVAAAINGDTALGGDSVNVAVNNNNLTIVSSRFGSGAELAMLSGTALSALGFVGGESAQGRDVVGSFLVNGDSEPAVGSGQFLSGNAGNTNTANLQMRVTLTAAQVGAGIQVPVSVSRGIASQLDRVMTGFFDPINGRLKQINDDFKASLQDLSDQEAQQKAYLDARTAQLQAQFAQMERTLSQLQAASNTLNALAASLNANSSNSSKS